MARRLSLSQGRLRLSAAIPPVSVSLPNPPPPAPALLASDQGNVLVTENGDAIAVELS